jgi:uncharacterized protein YbaR (Trm112 family)
MDNALDDRLRGLLVCPKCRGELEDRPGWLACATDGVKWPVVNGTPHLVPECEVEDGDLAP